MYVLVNDNNEYFVDVNVVSKNIKEAKVFSTLQDALEYSNGDEFVTVNRYYLIQEGLVKFQELDVHKSHIVESIIKEEKLQGTDKLKVEFIETIKIQDKETMAITVIGYALGQMNYQVENGGLYQYLDNSLWIPGAMMIPLLTNFVSKHNDSFSKETIELFEFMNKYFSEFKTYIGEDNDYCFEIACDECDGTGYVDDYDYDEEEYYSGRTTCEECSGTGVINVNFAEFVSSEIMDIDDFDSKYYNFKPYPLEIIDDLIRTLKSNKELLSELNQKIIDVIVNGNDDKESKPKRTRVKLIGKDGNIFNLVGLVREALRKDRAGHDVIEKFTEEIKQSKSYDDALQVIMKYVDVA